MLSYTVGKICQNVHFVKGTIEKRVFVRAKILTSFARSGNRL